MELLVGKMVQFKHTALERLISAGKLTITLLTL